MKICFLNGDMSRSGGTERVTSLIANGLCLDESLEVHILSVTNERNESYFELDESIKHETVLKQSSLSLKRDYFKVVRGIRQYLIENQIDVLIDVDVICNVYSILARWNTKVRHISWEHFNYFSNNGSVLRDVARQLTRIFSEHVVVLTEQDKQNYSKHLNISHKVSCIYNPIVSSKSVACDVTSKQVLSVGRLTYQKGFDLLCEIARDVFSEHPDWTWLILGEGEDRALLEQKIHDYGLSKHLILKGNVTDVASYYESSSLFVMTSRYEGLPMTLLEAKVHQLPIVSFDCQTGPRDIISHDIDGYLIPVGELSQMKEALKQLMRDESKRQLFSEASRQTLPKFNYDKVVSQWKALLFEH